MAESASYLEALAVDPMLDIFLGFVDSEFPACVLSFPLHSVKGKSSHG